MKILNILIVTVIFIILACLKEFICILYKSISNLIHILSMVFLIVSLFVESLNFEFGLKTGVETTST